MSTRKVIISIIIAAGNIVLGGGLNMHALNNPGPGEAPKINTLPPIEADIVNGDKSVPTSSGSSCISLTSPTAGTYELSFKTRVGIGINSVTNYSQVNNSSVSNIYTHTNPDGVSRPAFSCPTKLDSDSYYLTETGFAPDDVDVVLYNGSTLNNINNPTFTDPGSAFTDNYVQVFHDENNTIHFTQLYRNTIHGAYYDGTVWQPYTGSSTFVTEPSGYNPTTDTIDFLQTARVNNQTLAFYCYNGGLVCEVSKYDGSSWSLHNTVPVTALDGNIYAAPDNSYFLETPTDLLYFDGQVYVNANTIPGAPSTTDVYTIKHNKKISLIEFNEGVHSRLYLFDGYVFKEITCSEYNSRVTPNTTHDIYIDENVAAVATYDRDISSLVENTTGITVLEFDLTQEDIFINTNEGDQAVSNLNIVDPDGDGITTSSIYGTDAELFTFAQGKLSFISKPDFETPVDADQDNVYNVCVEVVDSDGNKNFKNLSITLQDVAETFSSESNQGVIEEEMSQNLIRTGGF